jgi:hypothetical protein
VEDARPAVRQKSRGIQTVTNGAKQQMSIDWIYEAEVTKADTL